MAKRKKTNWDDVRWTPFEEIEPPGSELPNNRRWAAQGLAKWFANSIYVVRAIAVGVPSPFGVAVCLTVRTHDHQARHDWRELQRIKNEIAGPSVEAVEVYPAEGRLVDNSNYYHLFCFPRLATEDGLLPFGFPERVVTEGDSPVSRQRAFRPELRPDDVLELAAPTPELGPNDKIAGRCTEDGSAVVFRAGVEATLLWNGKPVKMARGECLMRHHVFLVAARKDLEDVGGPPTDLAPTASEGGGPVAGGGNSGEVR